MAKTPDKPKASKVIVRAEVPPDLKRKAKAAAAVKGLTLTDVIVSAFEDIVRRAGLG